MSFNLNRLNPNQREAVLHGDGPLLILAGAGSGKTSTMAYRIAHLIAARNIPGTAILGLSFTNKAATELKERVWKLVREAAGKRSGKGLMVTTFHSLCVRILRAHGTKLGYQSNFSILDQSDQRDILRDIFRNLRIDDRRYDLDTILFQIGQAKSRFLGPQEAEQGFFESRKLSQDYIIATVSSYEKYQAQLKALNSMDFDDLLVNAVRLLEQSDEVREHYNARFRHILVDEYQDTNPTQFRLLRLLTQKQQNLCVVGDDDQSIYSWRGACASHILEFKQHYPEAHMITLDQNYRSTQTILDAANSVIANNRERYPKKLWSDKGQGSPLTEIIVEEDRAEGEFVATQINKIAQEQQRPWNDFAILYRSNSQSRIFEEALRRNGVPYKIVGGLSFLDRKEVKDVLSYWRVIANPKDDVSLRRILNWPSRGIGKTAMEALNTHAFQAQVSLLEALTDSTRVAPRAAAPAIHLRNLIQGWHAELQSLPPLEAVSWARRMIEQVGVKKAIEEEEENDPVKFNRRWENVEELLHSLGQVQHEGTEPDATEFPVTALKVLQDFLTRMTLEAQNEEEEEEKERDKKKNEVTLLTLHGAKGLEFPIVFLVGAEEGFLPHKRTIEEATDYSEERRLCYVGLTRAKERLFLTRARNRIRYGKQVPRIRSRFMDEIPADVLLRQDESHGPDASDSKEARKQHEEKVKDYLSGIRSMLTQGKSLGKSP